MNVFTIGYEGIDIDDFMLLLSEHGIETVVDVRELPLSRKPGFSKKSLSAVLNSSGLEYLHISELGCPKSVRDRYKEDSNWKRYTDGYLKHLNTQREAIADLSELCATSTCVLLCYEADHNFCHRSMVADAVHLCGGGKIHHISADNSRKVKLASSLAVFA